MTVDQDPNPVEVTRTTTPKSEITIVGILSAMALILGVVIIRVLCLWWFL